MGIDKILRFSIRLYNVSPHLLVLSVHIISPAVERPVKDPVRISFGILD